MSFSKDQIKEAKQGTHFVVWQPGAEPDEVQLVRVRGDFVWVSSQKQSGDISLNKTASRLLMQGKYRVRG